MLAIIGAVIVTGAIIGGYIWEDGHLMVLFQPAEFLIIGGAGLGMLLISMPIKTLKDMVTQIFKILGSGPSKEVYIELLVMMYELFNVARKDGLVGLESHVEHPSESSVLGKYSYFMNNPHALHFLADTMRLVIMGGVPEHDLEAMMDLDLETHHEENEKPSSSIAMVADSLPGLGIVAAVLGVIITMGAIGGPPEEIGHKVGAALVGTFLGILLSYGYVGPLARNLMTMNETEGKYYVCLKQGLLAFHKGFAASIAVEFARRVIPNEVRPTFEEVEDACRASRGGK